MPIEACFWFILMRRSEFEKDSQLDRHKVSSSRASSSPEMSEMLRMPKAPITLVFMSFNPPSWSQFPFLPVLVTTSFPLMIRPCVLGNPGSNNPRWPFGRHHAAGHLPSYHYSPLANTRRGRTSARSINFVYSVCQFLMSFAGTKARAVSDGEVGILCFVVSLLAFLDLGGSYLIRLEHVA